MINKLISNIQKTKAPICVGLDPMLSYIPEHVQKRHMRSSVKRLKEQQRQSGSSTRRLWTRLAI